MFDNQSFHPGTASRGVEYALDFGAGTATLVNQWVRTDGQEAFGLGSLRLQDDGTAVVGWGALLELFSDYLPGHSTRPAMVVTMSSGINYRVVKLPLGALDQAMLRSTAG